VKVGRVKVAGWAIGNRPAGQASMPHAKLPAGQASRAVSGY